MHFVTKTCQLFFKNGIRSNIINCANVTAVRVISFRHNSGITHKTSKEQGWETIFAQSSAYREGVISIFSEAAWLTTSNERKERMATELHRFLCFDSLFYIASLDEWASEKFDRIVSGISRRWNFKGLKAIDTVTEGLSEGYNAKKVSDILKSFTALQLATFNSVVRNTASFLMPLAFLEKIISEEELLLLGRYEVEKQAEKWGRINYSHLVPALELKVLARFLELSFSDLPIKDGEKFQK